MTDDRGQIDFEKKARLAWIKFRAAFDFGGLFLLIVFFHLMFGFDGTWERHGQFLAFYFGIRATITGMKS